MIGIPTPDMVLLAALGAPRYTNDCASVVGVEGAYPPPN